MDFLLRKPRGSVRRGGPPVRTQPGRKPAQLPHAPTPLHFRERGRAKSSRTEDNEWSSWVVVPFHGKCFRSFHCRDERQLDVHSLAHPIAISFLRRAPTTGCCRCGAGNSPSLIDRERHRAPILSRSRRRAARRCRAGKNSVAQIVAVVGIVVRRARVAVIGNCAVRSYGAVGSIGREKSKTVMMADDAVMIGNMVIEFVMNESAVGGEAGSRGMRRSRRHRRHRVENCTVPTTAEMRGTYAMHADRLATGKMIPAKMNCPAAHVTATIGVSPAAMTASPMPTASVASPGCAQRAGPEHRTEE